MEERRRGGGLLSDSGVPAKHQEVPTQGRGSVSASIRPFGEPIRLLEGAVQPSGSFPQRFHPNCGPVADDLRHS
jgi:hypothetical protein